MEPVLTATFLGTTSAAYGTVPQFLHVGREASIYL